MKPDPRFRTLPKQFWATIRTLSQHIGYTQRGKGQIKIPSLLEMRAAFRDLGLYPRHIVTAEGRPTKQATLLLEYYKYRADVLNSYVEPLLMDADKAKAVFEAIYKEVVPKFPIPMNKQKGEKKWPAYLTAIVNMLIEANAEGLPCCFDPRELTTVTKDGMPLRTLARRVDGAFPRAVNPIAVWEIKEYYYTTTFGSRVADGVYETLLDGMEIEDLREHENIDVKHYLMVDAHYTWWDCGRSYLCRIIDMLNMGYVDEVLFGREVVERMPSLVKEWVAIVKAESSARK